MRKLDTMTAENVTFGVELETVIPTTSVYPLSQRFSIGGYHAGLPVTVAPAFNGAYWKAERDASIQAPHGYLACEFVSPVLNGAAGVENLLAMVAWINSIGGRVNHSCGCHIHIGLASLVDPTESAPDYLRKLAGVVNINATGIYAQTGAHRELNHYCRPLTEAERASIDRARADGRVMSYLTDRYRILNLTNVISRGTVEFRPFAGTLNADKLLHHLWTCLFITRFAAELKRVPWTGNGWASLTGGAGEQALKGLHRKMGQHCLVGAMAEPARKKAMKAVALRLARKWDTSAN